jgi:hypothetical protein
LEVILNVCSDVNYNFSQLTRDALRYDSLLVREICDSISVTAIGISSRMCSDLATECNSLSL